MTYTFKIQDQVKFHDGSFFTDDEMARQRLVRDIRFRPFSHSGFCDLIIVQRNRKLRPRSTDPQRRPRFARHGLRFRRLARSLITRVCTAVS
jgi:hypothetical protein